MPRTFDDVIQTPLEYWLGTDKQYVFTVYTTSKKSACRDVTGYATTFVVKRSVSDADAQALLSLSGIVSGTFDANPNINTQVITVTVIDTDTDTEITPGLAYWWLKRTDDGAETVLAFGTMSLRRTGLV